MFSGPGNVSAFFERLRAALAPEYELLPELGRGGMGTVYLARDVALDCLVAVKVLRPELWTAQSVKQFVDEARILANLRHPNIVPVHSVHEKDGLNFYVMDYLEGDTLQSHLETHGRLSVDAARKVGRDLLAALGKAHRKGVIHRDVKPANVFLDEEGAVLTDFGIARRVTAVGQTDAQTLQGTAAYMAPEQFLGVEANERTDMYAAGMVIYEAVTGRRWEKCAPTDGDWTGVPPNVARVLRRAMELDPNNRWPHATLFRRELWRTRGWKYQRRTIGLSVGALVAGAAGATWIAYAWLHGTFPFRPPGSLQVVVTPFEDVCEPDPRSRDRLAHSLVRHLQGNVDFSVEGPKEPPWFVKRSTVVVRGTVCARRDSLHVEVRGNLGLLGADPAPVKARADTGHLDGLADTLAYGIVLHVWNRENPLDPVLPIKALPRGRGLAAWLAAERLLAQGRWEEADRAYEAAEEVDSTCWLCAWRHADVDKWLGRRFDQARASRYFTHIDSFPAHYQVVIRASRQPLVERLAMLTRVTRERRDFLPAHFMLADELYHRGPLIGRPRREAIVAFERVVRLRPDFLPAWEHLAWALAADGRHSAARAALERLDASGPARDPFSAELRVLLHVGLTCRFDGSAACRRISDDVLPQAAGYPDLAAGPRYLMTFDAPRGAVVLGLRFADRDDGSDVARSGLVALVDGYLALGLADSARSAARQLRGAPELDLFALELDAALLLLDPDSTESRARWDGVRGALAGHAHSRATTPESRRRAAWMLLLLSPRLGGLGDSDLYARFLAGETGRRPLGAMIGADAAARQGRLDAALTATDPLTALPADSLGDPALADPFFRTVLHLMRAGWHERRGDPAGAANELVWFENNDVADRPSGPPQAADMDWAFGTLARWRLARLLDQSGRASPCAAYRWVAESWAHGDERYRARADSAVRRLQTLGCKEAT